MIVVVHARRYQCQRCEAVILVVPRGVLPWKHFAATAIGFAIALWALAQRPAQEVRQRTSPWRPVDDSRQRGWATLRRWVRDVRDRRLFVRLRRAPASGSLRRIAAHAGAALVAEALPSLRGAAVEVQAFAGAERVA